MGREFAGLCVYCEGSPRRACIRCGASLCRRHDHDAGHRCDACEADYGAQRGLRAVVHAAKTSFITAMLLALVVVFAIVTGGGALALAPLVLFCAIPLTLLRLEYEARQRFLAETVQRQLPAAVLYRRR